MEAEPELTPQQHAAKYPEVVQHITVRYNGKEKIFNTTCWSVNLYDALRKIARDDAAERSKAALGVSKGMIEAAKATLADLAAEGARSDDETEEEFNARVEAAEEAAAAAESDFADLKTRPKASDVVDLADAETGQLQGVNIRGKHVFANTFIKTRTVYVLTRIESASVPFALCACRYAHAPLRTAEAKNESADFRLTVTCAWRRLCVEAKNEETGEETGELVYEPMIPPLEQDEEGNDIEPEGYVKLQRKCALQFAQETLHVHSY